jgi:hypothetical protein
MANLSSVTQLIIGLDLVMPGGLLLETSGAQFLFGLIRDPSQLDVLHSKFVFAFPAETRNEFSNQDEANSLVSRYSPPTIELIPFGRQLSRVVPLFEESYRILIICIDIPPNTEADIERFR